MTTSNSFLGYIDLFKKYSKAPVLTDLDTFYEPIAIMYLNQKKFDGVKIGQFELCIWSKSHISGCVHSVNVEYLYMITRSSQEILKTA